MSKYFGIVGVAAVTLMPGYVTPGSAANKAANTALTKNAAWKDHLILAPVQNTALTAPSSTAGGMEIASVTQLMNAVTSQTTFASIGSFCLGAAYTKATKVRIDKFRGSLKRSTTHKYFVDAYSVNGAGTASTRVASVQLGTYAGFAGGWFNPSATFTTGASKTVTVPAGGHLVMRAVGNGGTSSGIKLTTGWKAGAISSAFILITTESPAIPVASVENRERFNDSTGNPLPDGTKVYEYDASTMAYTGIVGLIGGAAVGSGAAEVGVLPAAVGVGEVVFTRVNADVGEYFYIIPDPASGNVWTLNSLTALGAKINPSSLAKLVAECTTAGTTGATEPLWDTLSLVKGSTVVDGTATWTMVEVETLCTGAVTGYQLGHWSANMAGVISAAGPPVVSATIVAPSDATANQHAVCTTAGVAGAIAPIWTGLAVGATVVDGTITWTITADAVYD